MYHNPYDPTLWVDRNIINLLLHYEMIKKIIQKGIMRAEKGMQSNGMGFTWETLKFPSFSAFRLYRIPYWVLALLIIRLNKYKPEKVLFYEGAKVLVCGQERGRQTEERKQERKGKRRKLENGRQSKYHHVITDYTPYTQVVLNTFLNCKSVSRKLSAI